MSASSSEPITLLRDCEAVQIPSGVPAKLTKGARVVITQSLGGAFTVMPESGGLLRIANADADALGLQPSAPDAPASSASSPTGPLDEKLVWEQLKSCFDPEIPVNIVDLGLVYDLKIQPLPQGGNRVDVKMTLTAPGCGMGVHIAADAKSRILTLPGVKEAEVAVVWDPPWNQSMISADGKAKLGMA